MSVGGPLNHVLCTQLSAKLQRIIVMAHEKNVYEDYIRNGNENYDHRMRLGKVVSGYDNMTYRNPILEGSCLT